MEYHTTNGQAGKGSIQPCNAPVTAPDSNSKYACLWPGFSNMFLGPLQLSEQERAVSGTMSRSSRDQRDVGDALEGRRDNATPTWCRTDSEENQWGRE